MQVRRGASSTLQAVLMKAQAGRDPPGYFLWSRLIFKQGSAFLERVKLKIQVCMVHATVSLHEVGNDCLAEKAQSKSGRFSIPVGAV